MLTWIIIAGLILVGLTAMLVGSRAAMPQSREGKILVFVSLLILPVAGIGVGYTTQMARAQSTAFCLSCHTMSDYGRSLYVDNPRYLAAWHFQNNAVPRERACYTCHTDYTLFGDITAKLRGLRHLWVHYVDTPPAPQDIRPYAPYSNRECLHCHLGARNFEAAAFHHSVPDQLASMKADSLSCLSCHETIHEVRSLSAMPMWKEH